MDREGCHSLAGRARDFTRLKDIRVNCMKRAITGVVHYGEYLWDDFLHRMPCVGWLNRVIMDH